MKALDTILFDLDGTLLPIEQGTFIDTYFGLLANRVSGLGHDPRLFFKALWEGTGAMLNNDGTVSNSERFWQTLYRLFGSDTTDLETALVDFYATDFNETRAILSPRPPLRPLLDHLRAKGYGVTLATNPLFPYVAVQSRLSWIGLLPSDFDYISTYENSRYCKPHPGYYQGILAHLGKEPAQCLMIGNSPADDMAAIDLGISVFLLTDHLENAKNVPLGDYPQGGFAEMEAFLRELPAA
mgnify:FL=1